MKTRFLIIIVIVISLGFTGTAFATHDPSYNHPTPFGLEPELPSEEKLNDTKVNYVDFRDADGEIIEVGCSIGLRAPEYRYFGDSFLDSLKCNPTVTLIPIFVLIGIIIAIIFVIRRKRK